MKHPILTTFIGASLAAAPVFAETTSDSAPVAPQAAADQSAIVGEVANQVKANPESAGEIVKNAIIKSKADSVTVAQIVKAAILASPNQIHSIYNNAMAVAPDAGNDVKLMIASMIKGDQVAAASANVQRALDFIRDSATTEPEGLDADANVVWLESFGKWLDSASGQRTVEGQHTLGGVIQAYVDSRITSVGATQIPPTLTDLVY